MKGIASLLTVSILLTGCDALLPQRPPEPTPQMQMAHQYYLTGNPTEALAVLEQQYEADITPPQEKQNALALAILIHLENGHRDSLQAAEKLLPQLEDGDNAKPMLLKRALEVGLNITQQASSEASACERELTRVKSENRVLEQTVTKLRALSLE
ncbi:hypothetical protein [Litorivivens sp.]|uniref:hypothetical protein n=1 Tax=Litorivivens sp. TaxID=2020868 RepID=UPI0035689CDD